MKQHYKIATVVVAGITGTGSLGVSIAQAAPVQAPAVHGPAVPAGGPDFYAKGKVISHSRLAIRAKPTRNSTRYGWLLPGEIVDIKCWARGQSVQGNRRWYRLGISTPEWVAGKYIKIVKGKVEHC
ncbi:hypothetical protein GCM10022254_16180 [Actinomadura meridiana]|uniref:SH3 domain-containing protein n=1 Tax=Actinomadura meridiana TaxID=559626 RepID=A0ABP8BVU5_9ACTN